jgi:hypothetical protein
LLCWGESRLSLQFSNSSRTETRQMVNGVPSGEWTGKDGVQHAMALHNLHTSSSWFCPSVALSDILSAKGFGVEFVGHENRNELTVEHYTISAKSPVNGAQNTLFTRLMRMDVYLDPQTLRPVELGFNIHPDKNMLIDIPVSIRLSDYKNTNGQWIPFTIEKYVNSVLALRLQVDSASSVR